MGLSLRLRVFLFFALVVFGSICVVLLALWLGFRQLGNPDALSAFATSAIISAFGIAGLVVFVWLLFDENVCKPVERLAAKLRVRTHADVGTRLDETTGRYLGDLGPAVSAFQQKLDDLAVGGAGAALEKADRQNRQLLRILSDIPIAVIVANTDHQIILYDGQAADLMEAEAPARLNASVFDYLDKTTIENALTVMAQQKSKRMPITATGHSGAIYTGHLRLFGEEAGYTLMLEPLDPDAERPLVYDFDLLERRQSVALNDTALRDLCFVVFDSETTGLDPQKDKVVQLGAVRIVNGKLVPGETFETLINPGVPIPASSTKVHRITDAMVSDAPDFATGCRALHDFAKDAVIVAHNAPFDMAFLQRQAKENGPVFDHPVLDTVHLSAVVFGGSDEHTLDALCERFEVTIPSAMRHTAIGDAIATAQVFVAMLPIIEARGIRSFGDLKAEIVKHKRILRPLT